MNAIRDLVLDMGIKASKLENRKRVKKTKDTHNVVRAVPYKRESKVRPNKIDFDFDDI